MNRRPVLAVTFALLGNLLTRARVQALERVWVPSVAR